MRLQPSALVLVLACSGCLERDISRYIDEIGECTETTTGPGTDSSTTGTNTDTTTTGDTSAMTTTPGSDTSTTSDTTATTSDTTTGTTTDPGTMTDPSSTTGEPAAVCGNGITEKIGPDPEDCDDANDIPDDGCSDCGRDRLVFVTSEDYQGGIFDGLGGADQRCRSLADQAGLPNFAGFKAWLSDSQTSAAERLYRGRGRYVLVNGLVVADSWEALLAGELQNPINATETSGAKDYIAWTGTNPDGSAIEGADHCGDWTENNLANNGFWGNTKMVSAEWTLAVANVDQPQGCFNDSALYCFEQE